jgi:hypothetical protein
MSVFPGGRGGGGGGSPNSEISMLFQWLKKSFKASACGSKSIIAWRGHIWGLKHVKYQRKENLIVSVIGGCDFQNLTYTQGPTGVWYRCVQDKIIVLVCCKVLFNKILSKPETFQVNVNQHRVKGRKVKCTARPQNINYKLINFKKIYGHSSANLANFSACICQRPLLVLWLEVSKYSPGGLANTCETSQS